MDKRERVRLAREEEVCPQCGRSLDASRVGTGAFADGVFCSLECLTTFHEDYYRDRLDLGIPRDN